jgi:tol-pal system protein YbgF
MKFLPLLLIALVLSGCATPAQISQVREDVTTVYSEQENYKTRTDKRITDLENEIQELRKSLGTPEEGLRKQVVDQSLAIENTNDRIKELLGRIDELQAQVNTYWEEVRQLKKGPGGSSPSSEAPPTNASSDALYKKGFDAFQQGAYNDATQLFEEFVKTYPKDSYVPNALYWLGESYMNLKDYEKAIVQFQDVVEKFPKSEKAARSMLRQAQAFVALGDKKSSTTLLKRVVELFPKSEEARVAQRMLRGGLQ